MAEVLKFPTSRKRPYNGGHRTYHDDLPENAVRLIHPKRPAPPQRTSLVAFHLLTAILADMTLPQRHRIATQLKRYADLDPESESRADAYELLLDLPWRMEAE
jgi:hypothetical protein